MSRLEAPSESYALQLAFSHRLHWDSTLKFHLKHLCFVYDPLRKEIPPGGRGRTGVVPLRDVNHHNMCLMNCHYKGESELFQMATDLFILTGGNKIHLTTYTCSLGCVLPFSLKSTWRLQTAFLLRMLDQERRPCG